MTQEQTVKCRFCKKEIPKSQAYKVGNMSYYCNEQCHKSQENKVKYKQPKVKPNGETSERRLLTDYIQYYYTNNGIEKHTINWSLICQQIKQIEEKLKINDNWVRYVLWYMIEIKEMNLIDDKYDGSIMNLVEYYYTEAYDYWLEIGEIKKSIDEFEFEDKVVVVNKSFSKKKKYKELTFD